MKASTAFSAVLFALALTLGLTFSPTILAATDATRPNIILILPDDVGVGDYACLGNSVMHTPCVDAFAKEGIRFTQFHVSPTCSPCRSALMSGRHEFKNGVTHTILERERMSLKTYTLAQMLEKMDPNKKAAEKSGRQPAKNQRKNTIEQ